MVCKRCGLHAEVYVSAVAIPSWLLERPQGGPELKERGAWGFFVCESCYHAFASNVQEFLWNPSKT